MRKANGEGQTWNVLGEMVTCKATGGDTTGAYSLFEVISPPQGGAPLHIHRNEDEAFYVLEGELLVQEGDQTYVAKAGSFVLFRKGTVHTYKNKGQQPAKMLVVVAPGGYENFFEAMSKVKAGPGNPPNMSEVAAVAQRFSLEIVGPPLA